MTESGSHFSIAFLVEVRCIRYDFSSHKKIFSENEFKEFLRERLDLNRI